MSYSNGPRIVTNGLVLYLDAGSSKSYPGSGTTWTDLSGNNNNGTLTNGPTYNSANKGSIVFDGINDYCQIVGSITTSSATFICWIRRNGVQQQYDGIIFSRSTNVTGIHFQLNNQLAYTWNNAVNTYNWQSGLILPDLTWCMCAISVGNSSATAYLYTNNNISLATNSVSHSSSIINAIDIGRDVFATRFFTGNIAQTSIYNRALTVNEISQNYNATKGRYNL